MEYGYMLRKNGETVEPFCEGEIYSDLYGDTGYTSLKELLDVVETGDKVTLPSIYALGHNLSQVCLNWQTLKEKDVDVELLDFPFAVEHPRDFCSILSYLNDSAALSRKERKVSGLNGVKARGIRLGRRPLGMPPAFENLYAEYKKGNISCREAARQLDISHTTFLRWGRDLDARLWDEEAGE